MKTIAKILDVREIKVTPTLILKIATLDKEIPAIIKECNSQTYCKGFKNTIVLNDVESTYLINNKIVPARMYLINKSIEITTTETKDDRYINRWNLL